jgi:hypothetical protein
MQEYQAIYDKKMCLLYALLSYFLCNVEGTESFGSVIAMT